MEDSTLLLGGHMTLNKPFHLCLGLGEGHGPRTRPQLPLDRSPRSQLRMCVSFAEHLAFLSLGIADISVGLFLMVEPPGA